MPIHSILLIDDCDDFREITKTILGKAGYSVLDACCPHDAWQLLPTNNFDMVLCDLHMPFITGEQQADFQVSFNVGIITIHELQDIYPTASIIGLTATAACDLYKIRRLLKNIQVVTKPTSSAELLALVRAHDDSSLSTNRIAASTLGRSISMVTPQG